MKIQYKYKGELFSDIRDIVLNNKLKPDLDYILEEYIPFQVFITGRTFFKGVSVVSDTTYDLDSQISTEPPLDILIYESFKEQVKNMETLPIGSLSGGLDSSIVASQFLPEVVYTGYYKEGEEYDETPLAAKMADTIEAQHLKIPVSQQDFIDAMYEVVKVFCTPAGGLGSVSEYLILKEVLKKKPETKEVLFGHGGDEIFLAYFFNRLIVNFYENSGSSIDGMLNFEPSLNKAIKDVVDFMIISLINRAGKDTIHSLFVRGILEPMLARIPEVIDKLLTVNINWTLPSLLHLNQQMCLSLGVKGHSPFTNETLINNARMLNTPMVTIQKEQLRDLPFGIPDEIVNNYEKKGFPVPIEFWPNVRIVIEEEYKIFRLDTWKQYSLPEFVGVNRFSWGVAQAGMFMRTFFGGAGGQ